MHGKVPIGFEKPTDIVAMLRRVTAVEEVYPEFFGAETKTYHEFLKVKIEFNLNS